MLINYGIHKEKDITSIDTVDLLEILYSYNTNYSKELRLAIMKEFDKWGIPYNKDYIINYVFKPKTNFKRTNSFKWGRTCQK